MHLHASGITIAILLSVIGVAADALLKLASAQRNPFFNAWFALGCLFSALFVVLWIHLMQSMRIAAAGLIYAVASAVLLVVIGVMFFGERLSASEPFGMQPLVALPLLQLMMPRS